MRGVFTGEAGGFLRCRKASVAVEFALISPALFGCMLGLLQLGVIYLAQAELETATERSARALLTGSVQQSALTQNQFRTTIVCPYLPALFVCSDVMVDLATVDSFDDATTGKPTLTYDSSGTVTNSWSYEAGGAGAVLVLRVFYQFPVISPFAFALANLSNGKRLIMSTAVFLVEPYSASNA